MLRKEPPAALRRAAESRGFTAVLVSLALAAVVTIIGIVAFPADLGQTERDTAADETEIDRSFEAVTLGDQRQ